jgi:eukaryotic-like serine/threonine-protein kinase
MTDWDTISRLWRDALSLDPVERNAFLDEVCADEPELRRQLESLLEPGADASEMLIAGLGRLWADLKSDADESHVFSLAENAGNVESVEQRARDILFKSSPFSILNEDTLSDLLPVMHLREYEPGEHLIRQGDQAEFLLLMLSGYALARVREMPPDLSPIGDFGPGDIVGEISLVTDEPRTADVLARTKIRALCLMASDFHRLAERHPDLRVLLTEVVTDRLGHAKYDGLGGKDIHGYQIIQCIGRGGMGVVYEARQLAQDRIVALKMMNHRLIYQLHARRRFRREAAILETLDHPSVARLYDCFSAYKTEFLAMEFCRGQTLRDVIAERGPLEEELVRRIFGQLAVALKYVHGCGVVHRDLKPSNILLTTSGSIKLLDFGIVTVEEGAGLSPALMTDSHHTAFLGTPRYMAPELFAGRRSDRRADFYGLACAMFEALSGHPAIEATDILDIVRKHAQFTLPRRETIGSGISQETYDVLLRGLEPSPERRELELDRIAAWAAPFDL